MRGSYTSSIIRQIRLARFEEDRRKQAEAKQDGLDGEQLAALSEEAAELKRARIMNRCEPGYERKDGKL